MWDLLMLLGRYEEAILEGAFLADIVSERRCADHDFNEKYHPGFLLGILHDAYECMDIDQFIFFLQLFYGLFDQTVPRTVELLLGRDESEASIILNGFILLYLLASNPEIMEANEE